jgi:aspartyl-tRNA(Asn)/glutamyl-tRNA(Gln) amidotransferase subunit C
MALTIDDVRKIATLARLRFQPEEESLFAEQLGKVVDYIDQLQEYSPASPASAETKSPGSPEAVDEIQPSLPREAFLANAPAQLAPFLVVPAVKGGGGDGGE